jgi:hypothetical protein
VPRIGNYKHFSYISFLDSEVLYLVTYMFGFRFNRRGWSTSAVWVAHMAPYVGSWAQAHQRVFEVMGPHREDSYITFLQWFWARTHVRVTCMVDPQPHIGMT